MASFKTAYLQREIVVDVAVKGNSTYAGQEGITPAEQAYAARFASAGADTSVLIVGDLVKLTPATGSTPAYIERVTSLAQATHIVAQSDQTVGYGHVPVENRDYRYVPVVLNTFTGTVGATSPVKKCLLFRITNPEDIELNAAYGETA